MSTYTNEQKLLACYLDLRRAAISFYKVPEGEAHKEFLKNVLETLNEMPDKELNLYKKKILNLKKKTAHNGFSKDEKMRIADDILTTGILLKSVTVANIL